MNRCDDTKNWRKVVATTNNKLDSSPIRIPGISKKFIDVYVARYNEGKELENVWLEQEKEKKYNRNVPSGRAGLHLTGKNVLKLDSESNVIFFEDDKEVLINRQEAWELVRNSHIFLPHLKTPDTEHELIKWFNANFPR